MDDINRFTAQLMHRLVQPKVKTSKNPTLNCHPKHEETIQIYIRNNTSRTMKKPNAKTVFRYISSLIGDALHVDFFFSLSTVDYVFICQVSSFIIVLAWNKRMKIYWFGLQIGVWLFEREKTLLSSIVAVRPRRKTEPRQRHFSARHKSTECAMISCVPVCCTVRITITNNLVVFISCDWHISFISIYFK